MSFTYYITSFISFPTYFTENFYTNYFFTCPVLPSAFIQITFLTIISNPFSSNYLVLLFSFMLIFTVFFLPFAFHGKFLYQLLLFCLLLSSTFIPITSSFSFHGKFLYQLLYYFSVLYGKSLYHLPIFY